MWCIPVILEGASHLDNECMCQIRQDALLIHHMLHLCSAYHQSTAISSTQIEETYLSVADGISAHLGSQRMTRTNRYATLQHSRFTDKLEAVATSCAASRHTRSVLAQCKLRILYSCCCCAHLLHADDLSLLEYLDSPVRLLSLVRAEPHSPKAACAKSDSHIKVRLRERALSQRVRLTCDQRL
jgi:hypothetical protein